MPTRKGIDVLDKLKHIDEAKREQDKLLPPNECQVAFAGLLDSIGRWDLFLTGSFKPNKYECIVQSKDDEFYQNKKLQWCGGERILKRRTRNGGGIYGSPSVAPGWGKDQALKQGIRFLRWNFKRSRWAIFVEGSKYRNCAHIHALIANVPEFDPDTLNARWAKKFGRFDIEDIKDDLGVAHYLAKGYVAKNYGKSDELEFEFSRNSRFAHDDQTPTWYYKLRTATFRMGRRGDAGIKVVDSRLKEQMKKEVGGR